MPKVSIIVPCWGVEKYLDRCVNSLVNQTLQDIEIILVDDESPDRVPEMCDEWAKKDSRIKVIHKKNGGLGYARNSGIDAATGEYIMFVDSDDTIKLDAAEVLYNACKKYDADVSSGSFLCECADGSWRDTHKESSEQVFRNDEVIGYLKDMVASAPGERVERKYAVSVCLICVRRSLIVDKGLRFMSEREVASEDTVFKMNLLKNVQTLVLCPYSYYYYYTNDCSLTHTFNISKFNKLKFVHDIMCEIVDGDIDAQLRVDRFIISDARMHILRLLSSENKEKLTTLKEIVDDEVWTKVKGFKPYYFPMYQRLFYLLILTKQYHLLYAYAWFVMKLKTMLNK